MSAERIPPSFHEQWVDGDGTSGVDTYSTFVTWWYTPGGNGGRFGEVARDQSREEFLGSGPAVSGVPAEVEDALRAFLIKHPPARK